MELVFDGYRYLSVNMYVGLAFCYSVGRGDRERCIVLGSEIFYVSTIYRVYISSPVDVHPDGNLQ